MITLVSLSKRPIFILSFLLLTLICFLPTETLGGGPAINLSYERGENTVDLGEAVFTEDGLDLSTSHGVSFNAFVASEGWYLVELRDGETDLVVGWSFVQDIPQDGDLDGAPDGIAEFRAPNLDPNLDFSTSGEATFVLDIIDGRLLSGEEKEDVVCKWTALDPAPGVWAWSRSVLSTGDKIEVNFAWAEDGKAPVAGSQVQLLTDLSAEPVMTAEANDGLTTLFEFTLEENLGRVTVYGRAVNDNGEPISRTAAVAPPVQMRVFQNDGNETLNPGDIVELDYHIPPPKGANLDLSIQNHMQITDNNSTSVGNHLGVMADGINASYNFTLSNEDFEGLDSSYLLLYSGGGGEDLLDGGFSLERWYTGNSEEFLGDADGPRSAETPTSLTLTGHPEASYNGGYQRASDAWNNHPRYTNDQGKQLYYKDLETGWSLDHPEEQSPPAGGWLVVHPDSLQYKYLSMIPPLGQRAWNGSADLPDGTVLELQPGMRVEMEIKDANLRAALERALDKSSGDEIRDIELETITHLKAGYSGDAGTEITDLEGIEYCVNLEMLDFNGQSSISPAELTRLEALPELISLGLGNTTQLTNLSALANLTGLQRLYLGHNNGHGKLNDISAVQSLTNLNTIHFFGNEVVDISALQSLSLESVHPNGGIPTGHAIDVLSTLTDLRTLGTSYIDWTDDDLSQLLVNLTNLEEFLHHHNASFEGKISDLSAFAHLPKLRHLKLEGQSISNLPNLSTWTSLRLLRIINNPLDEGSSEVIRDLLMAGVEVAFDDTILIGDWQITHSGNIARGAGSYYTSDSSITQIFDHMWSNSQAWVKVFQLAQEDPSNPPVLWQFRDGQLWVHRQNFLSQNLDADSGKSLSDPSSFELLNGDLEGAGPIYSLHFIDPRLNWSIPFRVQSMQVGVDVVNLVAGVSQEASDDYDQDWDVLSPPPPVAPVALHANWLHREGDSVLGLSRNYRSAADAVVFSLQILADNTPFTLLWDLSQVPKSFTSVSLRQVKPAGINMSLNLRHQIGQAVTLQPSDGGYVFEIEISSKYQLPVSMGWNMISVPGGMSDPSPNGLVGDNAAALLPMFVWNPEGFSYRTVEELNMGQAYWLLVWDESSQAWDSTPSGEVLEFGLSLSDSYSVDLKEGWNMLGSVAGVYDFSDPQDVPDGSIADYSLFEWKAEGNSYRASTKLEEGKGYWVLCWNDCQLSVEGSNSPSASPQRLAQPEGLITLQLTGGLEQQRLEIGWATNPTGMDHPLPPSSPQAGDLEAYLVGDKYRWSRQIQEVSDSNKEWHLRLKSKQPTILKVESAQEMEGQELVIREGDDELVVAVGKEIQLPSGEREYILTLQPIKPKVTQLLQNYPNPFNPETWIPFELNQDSDVSLTIYDTAGRQIRHLDLGFQPAGIYLQRDRAIYWDGRTQSGEQVASGTYFYTLKTAGYVSTQKMIILK